MQTEILKDTKELTPHEMLNELIRLGYIIPANEGSQFIMPSVYQNVPNITTSYSVPSAVDNEGI